MTSLKRLLPFAFVTLAVVGAFTGSASGRAQAVQFIAGNSRVVQGNDATVSVSVQPNGARCSLAVRYKGGTRQTGLHSVTANGSRASWTWQIPRSTHTGAAKVTASCAGAGRASKNLIVIGQVLPPSVQVVKTGWSTRSYNYAGTGVSYGVILANQSPRVTHST